MEPLGRFPRVLNGLPREYIECPLWVFLRQTQGRIRGRTQGQKPEGLQAPRVFSRGCDRGFARRKSRREPSIISRGSPLSTQGTSRGVPFTTLPPRLFHILSFFLGPKELKSNKETNNIKTTVNGAPRVYRG